MVEKGGKTTGVALLFRCFHIGLCAFMAFAAVDALQRRNELDQLDTIFLAAYVFVFALIFAVFEISQFKPVAFIEV